MDLSYHVAVARQQQLLSQAARPRRAPRRTVPLLDRARLARRRAAGPAPRPTPCPAC